MDGFILYMKKRKPPYFFFFNEFVVFRYSKKTEIVNRENGRSEEHTSELQSLYS